MCKVDHWDNDNHSKEELKSAINKRKAKYPTVVLSQDDHEFIEAIFAGHSYGDQYHTVDAQDGDSEGAADWADEVGEDSGEEKYFANVSDDELNDLEANLAKTPF